MSKKTRRKKKRNEQTTVYMHSDVEMIEYGSQVGYIDDVDTEYTAQIRQIAEQVYRAPISPEDRYKLIQQLMKDVNETPVSPKGRDTLLLYLTMLGKKQENRKERDGAIGELIKKVSVPLATEVKEDVGPPPVATFLCLLIPIRQREHLLGDLEEEYWTELVPKFGLKWARFYFYWHVIIELVVGLAKTMGGIIGESARSRSAK